MLKMKQRARIYYNVEQRNLMWDRWQKGDSMHVIAGLLDRGQCKARICTYEESALHYTGQADPMLDCCRVPIFSK